MYFFRSPCCCLTRVLLPNEKRQTLQILSDKPAPTPRQACAKLFCVATLNLPILDSVSRYYPVGSAGVLISNLSHECSQRTLPVRVLKPCLHAEVQRIRPLAELDPGML